MSDGISIFESYNAPFKISLIYNVSSGVFNYCLFIPPVRAGVGLCMNYKKRRRGVENGTAYFKYTCNALSIFSFLSLLKMRHIQHSILYIFNLII